MVYSGGKKEFIVSVTGKLGSLALDKERQVLYYTDSTKGEVGKYNIPTKQTSVLFTGRSSPAKITFVPKKK